MYSKPKNLRMHGFFSKKSIATLQKPHLLLPSTICHPPKYKILLCQEQISQVQANLFSYFVPRTKSPIGHKLRQRTGLQDIVSVEFRVTLMPCVLHYRAPKKCLGKRDIWQPEVAAKHQLERVAQDCLDASAGLQMDHPGPSALMLGPKIFECRV